MKRIWLVLAAAAVSLTPALANADEAKEARKAINMAYKDFFKSFNNRDIAGCARVFTPDAVVKYPGGKQVSAATWRAQSLKSFQSALSIKAAYVISKFEVAADTATVSSTQTVVSVSISPKDKQKHTMSVLETVKDTWKKTAAGWKLHVMDNQKQSVSIDEKPGQTSATKAS
jgi:ketosteroid isomerase-like protein